MQEKESTEVTSTLFSVYFIGLKKRDSEKEKDNERRFYFYNFIPLKGN
jgi:hypothetical protein